MGGSSTPLGRGAREIAGVEFLDADRDEPRLRQAHANAALVAVEIDDQVMQAVLAVA